MRAPLIDLLRGGVPAFVALVAAIDYFGEMSLLTGAPRSATIRAVGPAS